MPFDNKERRIEPDLEPVYGAWKAGPSPATTGALLKALRPTIDKGLAMHASGDRSPNAVGQARRLTLAALNTYDPARAKLSTHVINNLQGMRRYERNRQQVLRVPEQASLSRVHLMNAQQELAEELGRDPTDEELGDRMGWAPRRLERVRSAIIPANEGTFNRASSGDDDTVYEPATYQPGSPDYRRRAVLSTVYADLNPVNQKIFEWTLGWGGNDVLENREIARRLNLSPGAISQRKATIQQAIESASQLGLLQ